MLNATNSQTIKTFPNALIMNAFRKSPPLANHINFEGNRMIATHTAIQLPAFDEAFAANETAMVINGIARYENKQTKAHKQKELDKSDETLLQVSVKTVAAQIVKDLEAAKADRLALGGGKVPGWVLPVSLVDPETLAFLALNQCFITVIENAEVRHAVDKIGEAVEMEVWAKGFQNSDPALFKRVVTMAVKSNDTHAKRIKFALSQAEKGGIPYAVWDAEYRAKVGGMLLNAVQTSTALFDVKPDYNIEETKTKNYLVMTEGANALMAEMDDIFCMLRPMYMPMLTQPKPWTSMYTGCYNDERLSGNLALVRTYNQDQIKRVQGAIEDGSMAQVLKAVNAIQAVPLRINEQMLEVLEHCCTNQIPVKGLPAFHKFTGPEYPDAEAWLALEVSQKKLLTKERKTAEVKNRGMKADHLQIKQDIGTANELKGKPFALPSSCDFRGRVYPIPAFSHHRTDHVKNLFEFANGKALGPVGVRWLAIHLASTGDYDKVSKESFETRIAWTEANTAMIEEIGNDPKGTIDQWATADKPFSFLAACLVWARYKREGMDCISHLPIPLDGSNSGCQHLAAATLCEKTGKLVNLIKADKPQDLYQAVANLCAAQVAKDVPVVHENQEFAVKWADYGVSRKTVKRSVMVYSYSSEKFGFRKQLVTDLMEPLHDDVLRKNLEVHPFGNEQDYGRSATYMAGLIWDSVTGLVQGPAAAMDFLKKCSSALAHEAKPVNWVTPTGLPVQNLYQEYEEKKVNLFLHDRSVAVKDATVKDRITPDGQVEKRLRITFHSKPTGVIKKSKSKSTIAANWTHSQDASHLQMAVNAAVDAGMTDLLLIHDSFSTHACDTGMFQRLIKRTFVSMYQGTQALNAFRESVLRDISPENVDKIPALPTMGTLDLEGIMQSDYCFS